MRVLIKRKKRSYSTAIATAEPAKTAISNVPTLINELKNLTVAPKKVKKVFLKL